MADDSIVRQRVGEWLTEASDAFVSVFFPACCRICEQLLTRASRVPICEECLASFEPLRAPLCEVCGQPLEIPSFTSSEEPRNASEVAGLVCPACQERTYAFQHARSYAVYEAALMRAIVMLKFERIEPLGAWFASRLADLWEREGLPAVDVVVPVPLHRQRQRERGYNQTDLIARPLAKKMGLPYRAVLLVRTKPRPNKQILSLEERWTSVRGAFATRSGSQVDKLRVLLVDDVMTTGATLDACSRALRDAGARSVIGLTVARAVRHPVIASSELNPTIAR